MRKNNYKFRSKMDAIKKAIRVYVCKSCGVPHDGKRPEACMQCGPVGKNGFIHFGSQAEHKRYADLQLQEKMGLISGLELQPSFLLEVNGRKICTYRADFAFRNKTGQRQVEDVKPPGFMTDVAKIKIKLCEALYGIEIKIIER